MHAFCLDPQYVQASFRLIQPLSLAGSRFTSFCEQRLSMPWLHSLVLGLMRHRFTYLCILAGLAICLLQANLRLTNKWASGRKLDVCLENFRLGIVQRLLFLAHPA